MRAEDLSNDGRPAAGLGSELVVRPGVPSKRLKIVKAVVTGGPDKDPNLIAQWAARDGLIPRVYRVVGHTVEEYFCGRADQPLTDYVKVREQWVKVASPDLAPVEEAALIPSVYLERVGP